MPKCLNRPHFLLFCQQSMSYTQMVSHVFTCCVCFGFYIFQANDDDVVSTIVFDKVVIIYIYICSYIVSGYSFYFAHFIHNNNIPVLYMFKIIIIIKKIILTNYISYCSFSSFPFPVSFHYLIYCNLFIIFLSS